MSRRSFASLVLLVVGCGGGGNSDIAIKVHDKALETVKVGSALTNGKHVDLFLGGCKVGCDIYKGATCAGCVNAFALEKTCGATARYVEVKLQKGDVAPGKYDKTKFDLLLHDDKNGANLLFDPKTATLEMKTATSGTFSTDTGTKGTFDAQSCR